MAQNDYIFIHYSYGKNLAPTLTLHQTGNDKFTDIAPTGQNLSLFFNTTTRYCNGWHDLATSQSFPCPKSTSLSAQFKQCRHCQNKTGFNPAFYHAISVSPQQQARNATPHFLYLAHFAPGVIKVGISWAQRGIRRLLDQGARSALIIKTYPTATIARQYEAKIAALPGIAETLQVRAKHKLLAHTYDPAAGRNELLATRDHITATLGITTDAHEPEHLDSYYLPGHTLRQPIILTGEHAISGRCIGVMGSTLLVEQNGEQYGLCLNDFIGYPVHITDKLQANTHAPQQATLF